MRTSPSEWGKLPERYQGKESISELKPMSIEPLSDIIMTIYDNALAPDGWFKALRRISDFSGSTGCRLVIDSNLTGQVTYSVAHGYETKSASHRIKAHGTVALSGARELLSIGEPIIRSRTGGQLASDEPWHPGVPVSDLLTIVLLNSSAGSIVLEAMKTEGTYTDPELDRMRLICPHICRAVRISDSLNISRLTSEMFEASLEMLNTGVYVIGQHGRVVYLNRIARAQVKSARVLRLVDDHLVATGRDAQKLLQAELCDIESDPDREDRPGRAIALADGEGAGFVAHVLPLRGGAQSRIANHFAAIAAIFVQDPATAPSLASGAFAKLYGLTEGELRLLNGLTPGLSLAEAARHLGISEATAKTHLRRIFTKTKTSKQAELLYLMMTSTPPTSAL
jgi:DNA-binding CsgD family transcriptional regulator